MPELVEQMYCSQQIVIPPKFPYILKRFCKAAIKTQPYDLLRWSFEYFKALAEHRAPPVKLRLEYPVYSTEGGLTRGCLKVLANQLQAMKEIPLPVLKSAWRGFCLDPTELKRVICLCNCHLREETVPFLHFIAVAGGLLTKNLTHTMILLCETLTKEPDGGSAAIPLEDFLAMYLFLARMDASKDVRFINGYREGETPEPESVTEEQESESIPEEEETGSTDEYWHERQSTLLRLSLIDDAVAITPKLSVRTTMPIIGKIERSPSMEREGMIERENYLRERKGRAQPDEDVEQKLRELSSAGLSTTEKPKEEMVKQKEEKSERPKDWVEIIVADEDGNPLPLEFYGEPNDAIGDDDDAKIQIQEEEEAEKEDVQENEKEKIQALISELYKDREDRLMDLEQTFDEIAAIVDRFKSASYDLGMVAGRQMSSTSGEFIVHHIEREIMDYINEQIAILPDPDLKKKKAKPEEVAMVRDLLESFLDENMEVIVPEIEEVEEEEQPIPDIVLVYAVPGIGPVVPEQMVVDVEEYILDVSKLQADLVMPRNLRHFMCPPLEKFEEYKYDDYNKKEELPTGGVFTN